MRARCASFTIYWQCVQQLELPACCTSRVVVTGLSIVEHMAAARRLRILVCSEISGLQQAAAAACKARLGPTVAIDWIERSPASLAPGGDARQELLDATVLLADPGAVVSVIDDAAKLEWMQSTWAGVNVLFTGTSKRDYVCTRVAGIFGAPDRMTPMPPTARCIQTDLTFAAHVRFPGSGVPGVAGPLMAEYVLGYILLLERKLLLAKSQQEKKVHLTAPQ